MIPPQHRNVGSLKFIECKNYWDYYEKFEANSFKLSGRKSNVVKCHIQQDSFGEQHLNETWSSGERPRPKGMSRQNI